MARRSGERFRRWALGASLAAGLAFAGPGSSGAATEGGPGIEAASPVEVSVGFARRDLAPLAAVDTLVAPELERERLAVEDRAAAARDAAPRFADRWTVEVDAETHGTWELLDADTFLWRLRIVAPDALSLNLGFSRFHLPPGARLTLRSGDGRRAVRPFTAGDNAADGALWTPLLATDDLVLELVVPARRRAEVALHLVAVNRGYRYFGGAGEKSGACNVDVACPEAGPWRDQVRAVAALSFGGQRFCTGFLVNDTARDRRPYLMTAAHCDVGETEARSLVAYWRFESSTCRPPGSAESGGLGDGRLDLFSTGARFRASSSLSDFTLLELDAAPPASANVYLAGWNRGSEDFASATCIHHPSGDEKRITFDERSTTTTSYLGESSPGDGSHIHAFWALGVTEPGSSGSPLFDPQKRVVGQLHGGPSFCGGDDLSDYYGRFSVSWQGGGTRATRLADWLDPLATGVVTLDGMDATIGAHPAAPSDLAAKAVGSGVVELSWVDHAGNEDTFVIQMRVPGGEFRAIGSVPADTTTGTVSGLSPTTTYTFRVRARNETGASPFSNEATATTLGPPGPCVVDASTLCLLGGRFAVRATWSDGQGGGGDAATAAIVGAPDAGVFWFFSPQNPEVMVKMISACALPQPSFWVFVGGATTLEHTVTVVDTQSGVARVYRHAPGAPLAGVADTQTFATCP